MIISTKKHISLCAVLMAILGMRSATSMDLDPPHNNRHTFSSQNQEEDNKTNTKSKKRIYTSQEMQRKTERQLNLTFNRKWSVTQGKRTPKPTKVKGFIYADFNNKNPTKKIKTETKNKKTINYDNKTQNVIIIDDVDERFKNNEGKSDEMTLIGTLVSAPEHYVYIKGKGTIRFYPDDPATGITEQFEIIDNSSDDIF